MNIQEKLLYVQTKVKSPKNLYNSFGKYKYRNAEGILEAVKPYLDEVKATLTISDEIVQIGGRIYVKAYATLWDTETIDVISTNAFAREADEKKGMDDSQVTGTASSYARKYALNGLFLLDDTKDPDTDEYARQTGADKPDMRAANRDEAKEEKPESAKKTELISEVQKLIAKALELNAITPEAVNSIPATDKVSTIAEMSMNRLVQLKEQLQKRISEKDGVQS